jgi:hypothetical protein
MFLEIGRANEGRLDRAFRVGDSNPVAITDGTHNGGGTAGLVSFMQRWLLSSPNNLNLSNSLNASCLGTLNTVALLSRFNRTRLEFF